MFTQSPFLLANGEVSAPVTPTDSFWNSVILLAPFDSDYNDVRGGIAPSSTTGMGLVAGKFGNAARKTNAAAAVKYPARASFYFATAPFTIDGWGIAPSLPPTGYLFDIGSNGFALQHINNTWRIVAGGSVVVDSAAGAGPLTAGVPFHFELSRSGTDVGVCINGQLVSKKGIGVGQNYGSGSILTIGAYGGGGSGFAGLTFDDFRITLAQRHSIAAFNVGDQVFTPPTTAAPQTA